MGSTLCCDKSKQNFQSAYYDDETYDKKKVDQDNTILSLVSYMFRYSFDFRTKILTSLMN
jgi:hypothetical protein